MRTAIFDCLNYLHATSVAQATGHPPLSSNSLLSACVQAEATRHAGKLAAHAATNAYIFTLIAGILAFVGGLCVIAPFIIDRRQKILSRAMYLLNLIQPVQTTISSYSEILVSVYQKYPQPLAIPFQAVVPALPNPLVDLEWMQDSPLPGSCLQSIRDASKYVVDLHFMVAMLAAPRASVTPMEHKDLSLEGPHFQIILEHYRTAVDALERSEKELERASGMITPAYEPALSYLFATFSGFFRNPSKTG